MSDAATIKMNLQAKVSIAVIGTGLIGPRHAKSIIDCEDAELQCLVDPAPHAEILAKSFNVPLFSSVQEMLQEGHRPDGAIVCTPNITHAKVSQELLSAGIAVLVEKPISTNILDAERLVGAAGKAGKALLVGHHRRFNPYITSVKEALSEGVIGLPVAMSGLWVLCKPQNYFEAPTDWRAQADGGGVVLINMIHEVDILQYFFGPITRVHTEKTMSQRGHEAEEGAAIILRFASGLVGTFLLCDVCPSAHNWECATGENPTIPFSGQDCYRIFGTGGTLSVADMKVTRDASGKEKSWTSTLEESSVPVPNHVPFDEQMKHFVRVIQGKEEPRCSGEDGLGALIVCDAIKRSLADGMPVSITVPYVDRIQAKLS